MTYAKKHIAETMEIASKIDADAIEKMADLLARVKGDDGRIFFLGVGGSAGNCSHAVNDFRKIVGIVSLVRLWRICSPCSFCIPHRRASRICPAP